MHLSISRSMFAIWLSILSTCFLIQPVQATSAINPETLIQQSAQENDAWIAFVSDGLWVYNTRTEEALRLNDNYALRKLLWSPGGRYLATFSSQIYDSIRTEVHVFDATNDFALVAGQPVPDLTIRDIIWLRDTTTLVLLGSDRRQNKLYTYDVATGQARQQATINLNESYLCGQAASHQVAVCGEERGSDEAVAYLLAPDGNINTVLPAPQAQFSPDGTQIVYKCSVNSRITYCYGDPGSQILNPLHTNGSFNNITAGGWSPDNTKIAAISMDRYNPQSNQEELYGTFISGPYLYVFNTDGNQVEHRIPLPLDGIVSSWSPDQAYVLLDTYGSVLEVELNTGMMRVLARGQLATWQPQRSDEPDPTVVINTPEAAGETEEAAIEEPAVEIVEEATIVEEPTEEAEGDVAAEVEVGVQSSSPDHEEFAELILQEQRLRQQRPDANYRITIIDVVTCTESGATQERWDVVYAALDEKGNPFAYGMAEVQRTNGNWQIDLTDIPIPDC